MTDATIGSLLLDGADRWGDRPFISFEDGSSWTRHAALVAASRGADTLAAAGIETGDRVAVFLPNGSSWLQAWWGAALLGAVVVPLNTAYRGRILHDIVGRVAPKVIVADEALQERLPTADRSPWMVVSPAALEQGAETIPAISPRPEPSDIHAVLLTSGTTGVSKGSLTTHAHLIAQTSWLADGPIGASEADTFLADLPYFHLSSLAPTVEMLRVGGQVAVRSAPSLSNYWTVAAATGATCSVMVGGMAEQLSCAEPSPGERDHSIRFILAAPLPRDVPGFCNRFGVDRLASTYGSTEANLPIVNVAPDTTPPGSCGTVRPGFELRIVNEQDNPLTTGSVGQLLVRSSDPRVMSQGYLDDPAATDAAWRGGWFHTGDLMRADAAGHYFFVDRAKDCLRRRGENVSSFEVEREVLAHPAVQEVACVPVPSGPGRDDEIKVVVVAKEGAAVDPEELLRFLVERMPHFMVPRFFEIIDGLPKTQTQRIQKFVLRERGNGEQTWDRQAAGFEVNAAGLRTTDTATRETIRR